MAVHQPFYISICKHQIVWTSTHDRWHVCHLIKRLISSLQSLYSILYIYIGFYEFSTARRKCEKSLSVIHVQYNYILYYSRPFRLTRAIARARVNTRANLSAHAICRTHEKSYSAEKVLFHWIFFFQSFIFVYERHLWIMRYMSIAYSRRLFTSARTPPKMEGQFYLTFLGRFSVSFLFRTAEA